MSVLKTKIEKIFFLFKLIRTFSRTKTLGFIKEFRVLPDTQLYKVKSSVLDLKKKVHTNTIGKFQVIYDRKRGNLS